MSAKQRAQTQSTDTNAAMKRPALPKKPAILERNVIGVSEGLCSAFKLSSSARERSAAGYVSLTITTALILYLPPSLTSSNISALSQIGSCSGRTQLRGFVG